MKDTLWLSIEVVENVVKFTNNSHLDCVISHKRDRAKRKYIDSLVVPPKSFVIVEHGLQFEILSITWRSQDE